MPTNKLAELPFNIKDLKGFLAEDEGRALYDAAKKASKIGPCLEIGSYCGKSTVYLGVACKEENNILYAVDHHSGSEEHQPGEEYHDPDLYDERTGLMDSFREFRRVMRLAKLEKNVIPIVSDSSLVASKWTTPLGMVFIDGGHSLSSAMTDFNSWKNYIAVGGILAIHDIFPNPEDGGQAPFTIWKQAIKSGLFKKLSTINSLGLLRRI